MDANKNYRQKQLKKEIWDDGQYQNSKCHNLNPKIDRNQY